MSIVCYFFMSHEAVCFMGAEGRPDARSGLLIASAPDPVNPVNCGSLVLVGGCYYAVARNVSIRPIFFMGLRIQSSIHRADTLVNQAAMQSAFGIISM